jgi:hypothetical protein
MPFFVGDGAVLMDDDDHDVDVRTTRGSDFDRLPHEL